MVSKRALDDFKERTVNVKDYEMLLQRVLELSRRLFSDFQPKIECKTSWLECKIHEKVNIDDFEKLKKTKANKADIELILKDLWNLEEQVNFLDETSDSDGSKNSEFTLRDKQRKNLYGYGDQYLR